MKESFQVFRLRHNAEGISEQCFRTQAMLFCRSMPVGVLGNGNPKVGAQVVQEAHGASASAALKEGRQHVQEHEWIEDLHSVRTHRLLQSSCQSKMQL